MGLTPFVARLEELAARGGADRQIDLFYSTRLADVGLVARLEQMASEAAVNLHVIESPVDGPLTIERLAEVTDDWGNTGVWFCGPDGFGRFVRKGLQQRGLPSGHFHQELFQFR